MIVGCDRPTATRTMSISGRKPGIGINTGNPLAFPDRWVAGAAVETGAAAKARARDRPVIADGL